MHTQNRYRDFALHPDGKTFFVITDNDGRTSTPTVQNTQLLLNPGTILKFEYTGQLVNKDPLVDLPFDIRLYPNPATDRVSIVTWPRGAERLNRLSIEDVSGRTVWQEVNPAAKQDVSIRHLPAGIYMVRASTNLGRKHSQRLIIH